MSNLFSSFDPVSFFNLPLNWLSRALILIVLPLGFWASKNQPLVLLASLIKQVKLEFKASLNPYSVPGLLLPSLGIFLYILLNNSLGLSPYLFTASRHLVFTLALAAPLWVGHMVLASIATPSQVLAHLVPLGTPGLLIPFIVAVEIIRRVIRPLTLSIRLAANMTAGHLLLALLGGQGYGLGVTTLVCLLTGLILLASLETAVSLIQAYVFRVLSTLYINEVNSPQIRC